MNFTRTYFLILLSLNCFNLSFTQCSNTCGSNLLHNPGFETATSSCSTADIQLYNSQTPVADWFGTDNYPGAGSSPDYFSPCAGITNTSNNGCLTGSGRVGVFTKTSFGDGREYIQSQLTSPLVAGKMYCFSMLVKSKVGAAGNILSSCDGIGAWFHDQGMINIQTMNGGNQFLGQGSQINANPQVENPAGNLVGSSCVTVSGTFCAEGGEDRIVIGNFRSDANTMITGSNPSNYMYIDEVTLFELCSPTLDLLVDNDQLNCGESAVLSVSSTYPSGTVYNWLSPSGNTLNGLGPHTINPAVSGTYALEAVFTGTCGTSSDTVSLSVDVTPCGISSTIYDTTLCEGTCHDLQAYATFGGQLPYSFEWRDENNQLLGSGAGPIQVCPQQSGYYYLKVADSNGSEFTDSLYIQVTAYPTINGASDQEICPGESLQLIASSDGLVEQWQTLGFGNLFQVSPLISTDYVFESANDFCVSRDTVSITVKPAPHFTLSAQAVTCFGAHDGSATAVVSGNSPFTFSWSPVSGADLPTISGLSAGFERLTVTDAGACQFTDSIFISEPPQLDVDILGDIEVCAGETISLSAQISGGTPAYGILWNNTVSSPSYTMSPSANTSVTLTVTDAHSCNVFQVIDLIVLPKPLASFDANFKLCAGLNTEIENTSQNAQFYQWNINGVFASNAEDLDFSENEAGCYDLELVVENQLGCKDSLTKTCAVEIFEKPNSVVTTSGTEISLLDPGVKFFNSSSGGDSCVYFLGNEIIHQGCETNFEYNFVESGSYAFMHYIYNSSGCVDSSLITIHVKDGLIFYVPNTFTPDGNKFNNIFKPVMTSNVDPDQYHLQIFNRWGELLFESYDTEFGWDGTYGNKVQMDGVYVWKINFKELDTQIAHQVQGHITLLK